MILHELVRLYERLAEDDGSGDAAVPPYGFTTEKVSFAIVITADGDFLRLDDIRVNSGTKQVPIQMPVPAHWKRPGAGITPFFLCDNAGFLLGLDYKEKPDRTTRSFEASRDHHIGAAQHAENRSPLWSVAQFFRKWDPETLDKEDLDRALATANLVFRIDGVRGFIHQTSEAKDVWVKLKGQDSDQNTIGTCLVTGEKAPLSRIHNPIKGVFGGQSSGTSIVSFNKDSFRLFGKTQGENAPTSDRAAFQYVAALNHLTANKEKHFLLADSTVVFWAERDTQFANVFEMVFSKGADDAAATEEVRVNLDRLRQGKPLDDMDPDTKFYVLGIAPNASRLAIRFWLRDTVGTFADRLRDHLRDSEIEKQYDSEHDVVPIWRLVNESAARYSGSGKTRKASYGDPNPRLAAELMKSVLTGAAYPAVMLSAYLGRIRADREINRIRVAAIKAVVNRRRRFSKGKEVPVALQKDYPSIGYQLGRLFAALEKAQTLALGDINATIKDRYFGAASSTPGRVFPILMRLSQHHVAKAEHGRWIDRVIGEVMDAIGDFPSHLKLEEQGMFSIGYYHQRNDFYSKKSKTEEDNG
jgi:CRISPR-associated protein Csd1